jgi:D-aminoacyl-tRNA deacylase
LKLVLQRVSHGAVSVAGEVVGSIDVGLVVLVGVGQGDTEQTVQRMIDKLLALRIFPDEAGKMNRSVIDVGGAVLMISQFTLYADCRKGRRPAFTAAATPVEAERLYRFAVDLVRQSGLQTETGIFAADMKVSLLNDGPVTIILDSAELIN